MIWYFTPYSASDLAMAIFAGFFCFHLGQMAYHGWSSGSRHAFYLALAVGSVGLLFLSIFLYEALYWPVGLYVQPVSALPPTLLVPLMVLFAYHFPEAYPRHKREIQLAKVFIFLLLCMELAFFIHRLIELGHGKVLYRPAYTDFQYVLASVWFFIALLRQLSSADGRALPLWRKIVAPQGWAANTLRSMTLISLCLVALTSINMLRNYGILDATTTKSIYSLASLLVLLVFLIIYLNNQPQRSSFLVKLTGVILAVVLVTVGLIGVLLGRGYVARYQPPGWVSGETGYRFTPTDTGGYVAAGLDSALEADFGPRLGEFPSKLDLPFAFPFFGQNQQITYIQPDALLSFERAFTRADSQLDYGSTPAIYATHFDFFEHSERAAVHARADAQRAIITWAGDDSAIQLILYPNGVFDLLLRDVPSPTPMSLFKRWESAPLLAVLPGSAPAAPLPVRFDAALPLEIPSQGAAQDFHEPFRRAMHEEFSVLSAMLLMVSILLVAGMPYLFRRFFTRPLDTLLEGMRRVDAGKLDTRLPVAFNDEIGELTESFNKMIAEQERLIAELEERVDERTAEVLEQRQELAAQNERQRLARNLHDSITQSLHSIALFANTALYQLKREDHSGLERALLVLNDAAKLSVKEMRLFLFELMPHADETDYLQLLQARLDSVENRAGVHVESSFSGAAFISHRFQEGIYYIATEALNNALKHALSERIYVSVEANKRQFRLEVRDFGRGFKLDESLDLGMGLSNMQERATLLGGQLEIESPADGGTRVVFHGKF